MPRPFNMLRACFWLLAVILLIMVGETLLAVAGCGWLVLTGQAAPGVCIQAGVIDQARGVLSEALAAVLALIIAARPGPPPDNPP
jgi:hypothetical protein